MSPMAQGKLPSTFWWFTRKLTAALTSLSARGLCWNIFIKFRKIFWNILYLEVPGDWEQLLEDPSQTVSSAQVLSLVVRIHQRGLGGNLAAPILEIIQYFCNIFQNIKIFFYLLWKPAATFYQQVTQLEQSLLTVDGLEKNISKYFVMKIFLIFCCVHLAEGLV